MMFMKNEKKKSRHLLAIGVGVMAVYGAYSAVSCVKKSCCEKMKMLTKVVNKKKNRDEERAPSCECNCD